jgi:O-antigen biosynthesis protein
MRPYGLESAGECAITQQSRLEVRGKFLWLGATKFFLRGISYGPFQPDTTGSPFPSAEQINQDFALMRQAGINTIRTYDVPPQRLLDLALQWNIRVLVGIPWGQHICFLDDRQAIQHIQASVSRAVRFCNGHPSILAYFIGNEIPSPVVRWHGPKKVSRFLADLYDTAKAIDPLALVTYANYPPTEYLPTDFVDLYAFNVYLHEEAAYRRYVARLQNLAGEKPLVLSEFGMDAIRMGEDHQAETLAWQVRCALEMGAAGTVVFTWTDDWFTGGYQITDWAFGLVGADRTPRQAYVAVQGVYQAPCPPLPEDPPKVSVVVCAYNAEPTMRECLESLTKLAYPNYEVVIVDDGSTDRTGAIADEYPQFKVIHQPNRGLSAARNVGLAAATGEIIAYVDSDAMPDPDWLTYLALKFRATNYVGVGGPNLPPPEEDWLANCVASAPGSPTQILLDDETAEHIPGCNMAFRKDALVEVGGFDPTYTAAGDDVDICWRLQDLGYTIGFCPAAIVWHHRRKTIKSYLKQQMGYGRAEAMLFRKYPDRFNSLGNAKWAGRIYGGIRASLATSKGFIYYGPFGSGLFQRVYHAPHSWLADLPLSLEWNILTALLLLGGGLSSLFLTLGLLSGLASGWFVVQQARATDVPVTHHRQLGRTLVGALQYIQPLARGWARLRCVLREHPQQRHRASWWRRFRGLLWGAWRQQAVLSYWTDTGVEKGAILQPLLQQLHEAGYPTFTDSGWKPWDLTVDGQLWSRIPLDVVVENHGGSKRLARIRISWKFAPISKGILWTCASLLILGLLQARPWMAGVASVVALSSCSWVAYQSASVIHEIYDMVKDVAAKLKLLPINGNNGHR